MLIKSNNQGKFLFRLSQHLPFLLVIFLGVFLAYFGLQNSYFEQDEWHSFGNYNFLLSLKGAEFLGNMLVSDFPFHFAPLSLIFKMSLYRLFALNAAPYYLISIFLHSLVSISVYFLILMLTKKRLPAFLGALFFAFNSSHSQAVTWLGTFEGVEFSILFGSLSLISFLVYLQRKRLKFLLLASALLLIGLLFKETALTFLPVLALVIFFKTRGKLRITSLIFGAVVVILYASLRFTYLLFGVQAIPVSGIEASNKPALMLIYNFLTSPVKILAQPFFPNDLLVYISNVTSSPFNIYHYLARGPWVMENGFRYDLLTLPLGILLMGILWWVSQKSKDKTPLFWGLGIILFTILPLLALNRYLTYLDSRYLYPATLGLSIIISWMVVQVISVRSGVIKAVGLTALIVILLAHFVSLKVTIDQLVQTGQMRRALVDDIVTAYPKLPPKTIFYTNSDSPFYGTADNERIMPFQSGFGQLLIIRYNPTEHFASQFFRNDFLWNITDQGYKEFDGRGFGYFRNFNLLADAVKSNRLSLDAIISFSFDSKSGTLADTTDEVRKKLRLK